MIKSALNQVLKKVELLTEQQFEQMEFHAAIAEQASENIIRLMDKKLLEHD